MYLVPALEIGTIHLLAHREKAPVCLGQNRYSMVFSMYNDSKAMLRERLAKGEMLSGILWFNQNQYPGKVTAISDYVKAGWTVTFETRTPVNGLAG